jgi:hypothetical protein
VGLALIRGYGIQADPPTGLKWVELAARQELPIAQYEMGLSYRNGQIVAKNESIASQWFQLAKANDFTESQYLAGFSYIEIDLTIDFPNFASYQDSPYYRSTATARATLVKEGRLTPIAAPVRWEATVVNPKAPWWLRGPNDLHGLSWGGYSWLTNSSFHMWQKNVIMGAPPATGLARLTDIVGQRDVTLKAMASIDGIDYTAKVRFSFGKGPLSEFTSAPIPAQFAKSSELKSFLSLDSITADDFPAIGQVCHGSFEDLINYQKYIFDSESRKRNNKAYFTKSNIPTERHFDRIIFNNAYQAANWPIKRYWTNGVNLYDGNSLSAVSMDIATGVTFDTKTHLYPHTVCVDNSREAAFGEPAKPAPASLPWPY